MNGTELPQAMRCYLQLYLATEMAVSWGAESTSIMASGGEVQLLPTFFVYACTNGRDSDNAVTKERDTLSKAGYDGVGRGRIHELHASS